MTPIHPKFEQCITRKVKEGTHSIECKLGLWGVSGSDYARVEAEARRYWILYFSDGEYAKLLAKDNASIHT